MKTTTNIGIFAVVAFVAGIAGMSLSSGTIELQNSGTSSTMDGTAILGHIEVIQTDSEGNIKSYQQTDNTIVTEGRNCTAMLLFGNNTSCNAKSPSGLGTFTVIGVGNGTALITDRSLAALNSEVTGDGLARATGTLGTFTAASNSTAGALQRITASFTYTGTQTSNPINQAGLFNSTSTGNDLAFALKNFPSTVSMNPNDSLTVNWDITISGTDAVS